MDENASVKIDFHLKGELAIQLKSIICRGFATSKPEVVRRALKVLFDQIEQQDMNRARLRRLEEF